MRPRQRSYPGSETAAGNAADSKRWFLPGLDPLGDMPALPERLRKSVPD